MTQQKNDLTLNKIEKIFSQAMAINPARTLFAQEQMAKLVEESFRAEEIFNTIASTEQNTAVKGGFAAEEWHTLTFNNDAILNDSNARAINDNRAEWSQHSWKGEPLKTNDIPDVVLTESGKVTKTYQAKYNNDVQATTGQMSSVSDNRPKYEDVDGLLGPSDQVNKIPEQAKHNYETNLKRGGNPVRRIAYKQTAEKVTDRITDGKSSSSPLSKNDAHKLGKGDLSKLKDVDRHSRNQSTINQMSNAAITAAVGTALVSGTMKSLAYIQMAKEGKISKGDAIARIIGETSAAAADSALKASLQVGANSLITGASKQVAMQVLKNQLVSIARSNAVTVGVVCAVDAIKDIVRLGCGEITEKEFYERQGKNLLTTGCGVTGGSLGLKAGIMVASSLGVSAGTTGYSLILATGGLTGGLIAGIAVTLAIENGVEKPYRDLLRNTTVVLDSLREMMKTGKTVCIGQKIMTDYIKTESRLGCDFREIFTDIEKNQNDARRAVDLLKKH